MISTAAVQHNSGVWQIMESYDKKVMLGGYPLQPSEAAAVKKQSDLMGEISQLEQSISAVMDEVLSIGRALDVVLRPVAEASGGNSAGLPQAPCANELCARVRSLSDLANQAGRELVYYRTRLVV